MITRTPRGYFKEQNQVDLPNGDYMPGDRFKNRHEPTEDTFFRLLDSVANISESSDAAKISEQGLVKILNGGNVKNNVTPEDDFVYAAQVKNLPTISAVSQTLLQFTGEILSMATSDSIEDRNHYISGISDEFLTWLGDTITTLYNAISSLEDDIPDVSAIQSDIDSLTNSVISIESNISEISSAIGNIETDVTALDSRVGTNETDITQLQSDVAAISSPDAGFLGQVIEMSFEEAPNAKWILADGSAISRATYSDYFGKVGVTYGPGNGSTTFNIPDHKGKTVRGYESGNPNFALGVTGGDDEVTIGANNLPEHTHPVSITSSVTGDSYDSSGSTSGTISAGDDQSTAVPPNAEVVVTGDTDVNITTNAAIEVTNPYITMFKYIKVLP